MTDIARESMCKWDGWDDLDYSSIFNPMEMIAQSSNKSAPVSLDLWLHWNIGSDIGIGMVRTVAIPGIWKWFCDENGANYPNSAFDIPFGVSPEGEHLLFRRNRFYIKKSGEAIGVGMPSIEWVTWIDTEELEPTGFFFYRKQDKNWWLDFWPDEMFQLIDLG